MLILLYFTGHTIQLLSMVDVKENAPLISLLTRAILATIMAIVGDIISLIRFLSFTRWLFMGLCFLCLIIMKVKAYRAGEDNSHVFTVPILLPVAMVIISLFITLVPLITEPQLAYLYAGLFMVGSLIFYFPFVYFKLNVTCFDRVTIFFQLLFRVGTPSKEI